VLVQAMTEERPYEFRTEDAPLTTGTGERKRTRPAKRIANLGRPPWNVVNIDATVTVRNSHLRKATALDPGGYRQADVAGRPEDGAFTLTLPADALYTILE